MGGERYGRTSTGVSGRAYAWNVAAVGQNGRQSDDRGTLGSEGRSNRTAKQARTWAC